ncbi:MAG TPA: amino acid adenylation domain-containing protein [Kofleriaceae bacterium]|nr:amino acid adenylation domain-containing protein [Kofleriaceae bacterium]
MRSSFPAVDGSPVAVAAPSLPVALPITDLGQVPAGEHDRSIEQEIRAEAARPFDLARGPVVRGRLLRLADDDHVLLVVVHHIVSDGWSGMILLGELGRLYAGEQLPALPVQYADYAVWQRQRMQGERLEGQLAHWRAELAGAPPETTLPVDRPRPRVQTFRGEVVDRRLDPALVARLRAVGRASGATPFMTLLAGFDVLVSRWSGQTDVVVGTPVGGRPLRELEAVVGPFLNTVALRVSLDGDPSFREVLARVRHKAVEAYQHQEVPFERVMEEVAPPRDMSRTPVFQLFFNMLSYPAASAALPGLRFEVLGSQLLPSKFDLTVYARDSGDGVDLQIAYNADLFDAARIEELAAQYERLLDQCAADPDRSVFRHPLVTERARRALPDPTAPLDERFEGAIHEHLSRQAARSPRALAVVDRDGSWTYAGLEAAANRLAHHLAARVKKADVVAIWAHRSAPLPWAILAGLKAGATVLVLDPAHPGESLVERLAIARPRALLRLAGSREVDPAVERWLAANPTCARVDLPRRPGPADPWAAQPASPPAIAICADDAACLTFTSGSTGTPKAVVGLHGSLTHFVPWLAGELGLGQADRFSMLSGLATDPLQRDIFTALQLGATVCVPDPDRIGEPGWLAGWVAEQRVTVANLTPAMMQLLSEAPPGRAAGLRLAFVVGDVLRRPDVERLRAIAPAVRCVNLYGCTETQRALGYHVIDSEAPAGGDEIPLGRGMPGAQLLVVGRVGGPSGAELAGVGELGEILVRSPHLARGYLDDDDLTRAKFSTSPFSGRAGDRVYRTGDLGRYRVDGEVEWVARADRQVQVRGFRIEPREIEVALLRHPDVTDAAVIARPRAGDDEPELVAYVVGAATEEVLRRHLAGLLPDPMIPSAVVSLARLPMTPAGKLDRAALPAPAPRPADRRGPGTATEEALAAIWSALLGVDRVGLDDDFFALGGHSLRATQLLARVRDGLGVELPVRAVFESPTLAAMAGRVDAARSEAARGGAGATAPPLVARPRGGALPLSFAQQRHWFLEELDPGSPLYNIPVAVRLDGALDRAAFERALAEIVRRHEALRTRFVNQQGSPRQVITPAEQASFALRFDDLAGAAGPERTALEIAEADAREGFDLARGPLLRARLLRLAGREHLLVLVVHHIVYDAWSMGVLVGEAAALYRAFVQGRPSPLAPLSLQYADYALWQREWLQGETLARELGHWRAELAGAPPLELSTDRPRPARPSLRAGRLMFHLPLELRAELEQIGHQQGATLFMTILAAFAALLHRYSGQDDLCVGTPVAGRTRVETEPLIGTFVNTLVLRVDLSADPSFQQLLDRVRERALAAFAHQEVPFDRVVEELAPRREMARQPLFQAMFVMQNAPMPELAAHGLTLVPQPVDTSTSKFDLTLTIVPAADGLRGAIEYSADLFDHDRMERMAGHLETLLHGIARDPAARISRLPLLTASERRQAGASPARSGRRLEELFAEQVARRPDAIAVRCGEAGAPGRAELTYAELDRRSEAVARRLRRLGVGPETLVGLCVERSVDLPVGILAILKAGGAYVPLDPDYPRERLAWLVEDAGAPVVLTQLALRDRLPDTSARRVYLDGDEPEAALDPAPGPALAADPARVSGSPDSAAYIIYTSGSTGRPKGVVVTHRHVARLLQSTEPWFGFDERDVWTLFHSFAFDFSVWELWGALAHGGRLVVVPYDVSRSPAAFHRLLAAEQVTVLNQTPSAFRRLSEVDQAAARSELALRAVIFGGEALELESLRPWLERHGDQHPRLVNMYGITETTVHVTYRPLSLADLDARSGSVIGVPIPDLRVHLLDRHGQPVPIGVPGEIYVGGDGLARGYHDRPGLTAERFVPDPFGGPGDRLYRSGDLARRARSGELEYLRRADDQVKVRGFRIEIGEIESALMQHPRVRECAVVARDDEPGGEPGQAAGEKRLVAYVVAGDGETGDGAADQPTAGALLAHLRDRLPEYMLPAAFVALDHLPLTAHGKVDRRALPAPSTARPDLGTELLAPRDPRERALAALVCEVLGLDEVGVDDAFFDLGGHSLLAVRLVSRIREAMGVELPLRAVFESPTVAGLARLIAEAAPSEPDAPLVAVPRGGELPLSFMQERLWFLDRYEPGSAALNMSMAVRVRGPLSPERLGRALDALIARHESLRTRFRDRDGTPVAEVAPAAPLALPVTELGQLPADQREEAIARAARDEAARPFDLAAGPLVRAHLLRLADDEHVLLVSVHHIAADGWSLGILVGELGAVHGALARGEEPALAALPVQYADHAAWQRDRLHSERLERELGYWRQQLAGAPGETELPTDRARPRVQSYHGERVRWALDAALTARIRAIGSARGATPFMTLVAAFDVLVARLAGQEDLVVGVPVAGRPRRELEGVVGPFLNTVALRVSMEGDPSFDQVLARVREAALGAYQHQDVPFEKVLEDLQPGRDLSRTPVFQLFFNMLNFPAPAAALEGLRFEPLAAPEAPSKFDLTVYAAEAGDGLSLDLVYNADLFDRGRIEELAGQYELVLRQCVGDPDRPVGEASLVTGAAAGVLPDPLAPLDPTWRGPIHEHLSRQATHRPLALAVADRLGSWTYAELESASNRLARHLAALPGAGAGPGSEIAGPGGGVTDVVAIWAHRSAPLVWAILAGLKTGAAVLVLDPVYPGEQLVERLALARPSALVRLAGAPAIDPAVLAWLASHPACALVELPGRPGPTDPWARQSSSPPGIAVGPADPALLSFTSGSTGVAKGIVCLHRSLTHFVPWQSQALGLGPGDRFSMLSGLAHDPLQRDIFTALQLGAAIVVPDPEPMREPGWLAAWAAAERVTVAHLTPAMAQVLAEAPEGSSTRIDSLRLALIVGDVLTRRDVERVRSMAPNVRCVNLYGSTETQRAVGHHLVEPGPHRRKEALPLGRGMPGVQLLVVNRAGGLAGVGEVGEILVRSPHLAGGYLGDDEQSQRKFTASPFSGRDDDRVYRTGDLGRYLPDGEVEWAGRSDRQVKVRGFRVELGEIEAALSRHPELAEVAVIARPTAATTGGDRRDSQLVAYLVAKVRDADRDAGERDPGPLRGFLARSVPDFMLPAAFVWLDRLPLTPTGKLDRAALPPPPARTEALEPPRTPLEKTLAAIWSGLLGAERVSLTDDFFALGGHSLRATQLLARVRDALDVEVPVRVIFEAPTLGGFAGRVEALVADRAADPTDAATRSRPPVGARLGAADRTGPLLPSFAQQRLWFLDQLDPGSALYNVALALRVSGPVDHAALEEALGAIVRRHEVLRTRLVSDEGQPRQVIVAPGAIAFRLERDDLRPLAGSEHEAENVAEAGALVEREVRRGFALDQAPLLRARLIALADREHLLVLVGHHVAFDGWSMDVLVRELAALYAARIEGRPDPLAELPVQYADYALWQREWLQGEALADQIAHWRAALDGCPPLELPTDRPRPARPSPRGARRSAIIPAPLAAALTELGRREGATPFMVLLAAYHALLHRVSGQDDFCIGTPVAGRTRVELEPLIGFFANTLVLRADLSGDPTFVELLARVRRGALDAYAHQDLPFERLVEELAPRRDLGRQPLFQAMFALQNAPSSAVELPGVRLAPLPVETATAKFDLSLEVTGAAEGLRATFEYRTDLFDADRIERMAGHFVTLLEGIAAGPDTRVSALPLLGEPERRRLLEWRGRTRPAGDERLLDDLLARSIARRPRAPAVLGGDRSLSYEQLAAGATRIAGRLVQLGVGPGVIVGLRVDRSPAMVAAMLGVLEAGGAYLPIDPAHPLERAAFMLRDAAAPVLLTPGRWVDALAGHGARAVAIEDALESAAGHRAARRAGADDLAYVVYTSGTSGQPKGVMVTRGALANHVAAMAEEYRLGPDDRVLQLAPIAVDVIAEEVFPTLLRGGALVLGSGDGPPALDQLDALLAAQSVSVANLPASYWHEWVAELAHAPRPLPPRLRLVVVGSERVSPEHWRAWRQLAGDAIELRNAYGPSEATITATVYGAAGDDLPAGAASVPIGRPIRGVGVEVVDGRLGPAPIGVSGELCIGGAGLARGYLGRPDLTAERFVPDPSGHGQRLYRTGDRARFLGDGALDFIGRLDDQVKIRGHRIEPREVERALEQHPGVAEAVVIAREDAPGEHRLVAYTVAREDARETADLRGYLATRLPATMIPSGFVALDRLPRTPQGKVDRRALPAPDRARQDAPGFAAPRTDAERALARIWSEVLRVERVGRRDDFFDLGGHSLLALQVVARARRVGLVLDPAALIESPVLEDLAARASAALSDPLPDPADAADVADAPGADVPLTPIQRWLLDGAGPGDEVDHWNMALPLEVAAGISPDAIEEALDALIARHDALRLRFERVDGGWRQWVAPASDLPPTALEVVSLADRAPDQQRAAVEAEAARLHAGLDLRSGPLLRAAWFDRGPDQPAWLLLVAHHLAVDVASWWILLDELDEACAALERGEPVSTPPRTASFAGWARAADAAAQTPAFERELDFWLAASRPTPPLPRASAGPAPAEQPTEATTGAARASLGEDDTHALLALTRRHRVTTEEAVLSAAAGALAHWSGHSLLAIEVEGHGRETSRVVGADLSGTVGWFTSMAPLRLDLAGAEDRPAERLRRVIEARRAMPERGIGHGLLRHLNRGEAGRQLRALPSPEVELNFLGTLDGPGSTSRRLRAASFPTGPSRSPRARRRMMLGVEAALVGGDLHVRVSGSLSLHDQATLDRLAAAMVDQLRRLLADGAAIAAPVALGATETPCTGQVEPPAEALEPRRPSPSPRRLSRLVAIQPAGARPPIFCVHPLGGRTLCYRDLSVQLGLEQPLYGLDAAGLDGRGPPLERIEDMAARYLDAVRGRQDRGPYALAGWSFGGLVALEMAQQLRREGARARLILLDTSLAGTLNDPDDLDPEAITLGILARGIESLAGIDRDAALDALRALPDGDTRLAYLLDEARRSAVLPADIGVDQIRPFLRLVEASDRAWRAYRAAPYPGPALLLRTAEPPGLRPDDPTLGWGRVVEGDLDLRMVPGEHHRLLLGTSVGVVAAHLRDWLDNTSG